MGHNIIHSAKDGLSLSCPMLSLSQSVSVSPSLGRLPARILEAFERFQAKGDPGAVEDVVIAAVVVVLP